MKREILRLLITMSAVTASLSILFIAVFYIFVPQLEAWHFIISALASILIGALLSIALSTLVTKEIHSSIKTMLEDIDNAENSASYNEFAELIKMAKDQQFAKNENEHMRHEFTANVSHELKTPLTSISGYAEMIATGMAKGEDVKVFAEKIHSESGRLVTLIGDIIKLSELDETDDQQVFTNVDLLPLAQDTAELLSFNAQKHNIAISVEGESCMVYGNEALLSELIYNLCDNAIRYNRKNGRVDIKISSDGERSVLTVSDTGIGIPDEHQSRIFERFYRVDKSRSKETGGTGLGLAIVKHIAIQHDATIETVSDGKNGTVITVHFPKA